MNTLARPCTGNCSTHFGRSAGEIMTFNPVSIDQHAPLRTAAAFLTAKGISAAPAINEAGRPVGVLSRADIVRHAGSENGSFVGAGARVCDVMTPAIFSVRPDAPMQRVIDAMLGCNVHRVFVVNWDGELIGVISMFDLLRSFQTENGQRRAGQRRLADDRAKGDTPDEWLPAYHAAIDHWDNEGGAIPPGVP